jgi:hypothetical protein
MLFLTVYGPELESLFLYIHKLTYRNVAVSREQIYAVYLPHVSPGSKGQTKNIDDALHYLKATGLITGDKAYTSLLQKELFSLPFAALLLHQFKQLESFAFRLSTIDHLYITMLEQVYINPDKVWVNDVHTAANQLDLARQVGGVSQEKVNAWRRVMEFLGLGYRIGNGFYCLYQPELLYAIARRWAKAEGTLQEFFEDHLQTWLPCLSARGEVARPVANALEHLAQDGKIRLSPKQDSPAKPYFGTHRLKGIEVL